MSFRLRTYRWAVKVLAVLAVVFALQAGTRALSTRKIPFIGYYYSVVTGAWDYRAELVGRSNLEWMHAEQVPLESPAFAKHYLDNNIKVVLFVWPAREYMYNTNGEGDQYMIALKNRLLQSAQYPGGPSMLDAIVAIMVGEEMYGRILNRDPTTAWPEFWYYQTTPSSPESHLQTAFLHDVPLMRQGLETVIGQVKAHFPEKFVVASEGFWNDDPAYGWRYYLPPPANADVLNLNAYMSGNITSSCGPDMRAKFDTEVVAFYEYASSRFTQQLMMTGQAYGEPTRPMPAPCHLQWFYEYAQTNAKIGAILWFTYPYEIGGVQNAPPQLQMLDAIYGYNASLP